MPDLFAGAIIMLCGVIVGAAISRPISAEKPKSKD